MFFRARIPRLAWRTEHRAFIVAAGCLSAGLLAACPNATKDSHCTPDDPNAAADPDCIYAGNAKGPAWVEPPCPSIEGDPPGTCPTFEQVRDVLIDPAKGNCAASGCHGVVPGSVGIYLPTNDPCAFYAELLSINPRGQPYVAADNPATPDLESRASYMLCNLRGEHGGGFPMPIPSGMPNLADTNIVKDWLLCGAPGPIVDGAGGGIPATCIDATGGGGGGTGGTGGSGGAGDGGSGGMGGGGGS